MAVSITTTKPKAKTKAKAETKAPTDAELGKLVDTIIENEKQVQAAKDPAKKQAKARKELLALVENMVQAGETITIEGDLGKVKFSEQSQTRSVSDLKKIHEMMGDDLFYKLASIGIGNLDKYLTPEQVTKVTGTSYGSRSMTVLPN